MSLLDHRELASLLWLSLLLLCGMARVPFRTALLQVIRRLANWKIATALAGMLVYVALQTWLLERVGAWSPSELKGTVLWTLTSGFAMMLDVPGIPEDRAYFRKAALDGLKVAVLLEFFVNFYVFPLPVELLLVPTLTILAASAVVAQGKPEFTAAGKVINGALGGIGLLLLARIAYRVLSHPSEILHSGTAVALLLPLVNTVLFLPYVYAMGLTATYETAFIELNILMPNDELRRFTRWHLIRSCRLRLSRIERARNRLRRERPRTTHEVAAIVASSRESAV